MVICLAMSKFQTNLVPGVMSCRQSIAFGTQLPIHSSRQFDYKVKMPTKSEAILVQFTFSKSVPIPSYAWPSRSNSGTGNKTGSTFCSLQPCGFAT